LNSSLHFIIKLQDLKESALKKIKVKFNSHFCVLIIL